MVDGLSKSSDPRPHLSVLIEGKITTQFLVDTGACVSVISAVLFRSIPNCWSLEKMPVEPTTRLTAASGHQISIVGCFKFHLWFLGRAVVRPIYVVDGLSKSSPIFGIDVIREQQLMVSGEDVFFKDIAEDKWASLSTLTVPSDVCSDRPDQNES